MASLAVPAEVLAMGDNAVADLQAKSAERRG